MPVTSVMAQIRTTDMEASINFYVATLGFELDFRYEDFYAGIKVADEQFFHLKLVDDTDPSISFVSDGDHLHLFFPVDDAAAEYERLRQQQVTFHSALRTTPWGTSEFYVRDNEGHILCFSQLN